MSIIPLVNTNLPVPVRLVAPDQLKATAETRPVPDHGETSRQHGAARGLSIPRPAPFLALRKAAAGLDACREPGRETLARAGGDHVHRLN